MGETGHGVRISCGRTETYAAGQSLKGRRAQDGHGKIAAPLHGQGFGLRLLDVTVRSSGFCNCCLHIRLVLPCSMCALSFCTCACYACPCLVASLLHVCCLLRCLALFSALPCMFCVPLMMPALGSLCPARFVAPLPGARAGQALLKSD